MVAPTVLDAFPGVPNTAQPLGLGSAPEPLVPPGTAVPLVAPERIERALTRQILRGELPPGCRLAPVRELAKDFGVNPNTVQRALARLDAKGLVSARWGSGVVVNDPALAGDLSLVPDWLSALADDPDRAASVLAEFLEFRRVLAARLIARHRDEVVAAIDVLDLAILDGAADHACAADMAIARAVIGATGNSIAVALLNSVERALSELPVLVQAMYGEPERNAESAAEVFDAIRTGGDELAERVESAMAAIDAHTVEAYRHVLVAEALA